MAREARPEAEVLDFRFCFATRPRFAYPGHFQFDPKVGIHAALGEASESVYEHVQIAVFLAPINDPHSGAVSTHGGDGVFFVKRSDGLGPTMAALIFNCQDVL